MIFGKKRKAKGDTIEVTGMVDVHSHVLPGIDDGADAMETSVALVKELAGGGVFDIIATPHYMEETIYTSPVLHNLGLLEDLRKALEAEGVPVRVHLGNEVYICNNIKKLLENGEIRGLGGTSNVLVELPMSGEYPGYQDIFLELLRGGVQVILAHPERYESFQNDYNLALEMVEMGVLLQCNLGSFLGHYGGAARKVVVRLAREGKIFALGSDIHHSRGADFVPEALAAVRKCYDSEEKFKKVLSENARSIISAP